MIHPHPSSHIYHYTPHQFKLYQHMTDALPLRMTTMYSSHIVRLEGGCQHLQPRLGLLVSSYYTSHCRCRSAGCVLRTPNYLIVPRDVFFAHRNLDLPPIDQSPNSQARGGQL
jgi:hypothetical protein